MIECFSTSLELECVWEPARRAAEEEGGALLGRQEGAFFTGILEQGASQEREDGVVVMGLY